MKKYVYMFVVGMVLWACCADDDELVLPIVENKAPNTPLQTAPTNNQLCIDNTVELKWNASTDPDGDSVSYELQIATDNQFTQNLQTIIGSSTSNSITFDKGVTYYWRIKAKDSKNASSNYSSIFSFYTEGEAVSNQVPFSPVIVTPTLNDVVEESTVTLEWTASDADDDPLTFDVYLDTTNPPTIIVSENQSETIQNIDLNALTNYYWKVVVKDDKGGQTIGQVWNFSTD